jgi:hypothetical protein
MNTVTMHYKPFGRGMNVFLEPPHREIGHSGQFFEVKALRTHAFP